MTRHTRNRQMLKATNGKWGALFNRKVKNVAIAELNKMEIHLDKSFKWKREFDVKSTNHLPNYRQRQDYFQDGFPTFYITTFAQISFKRKTKTAATVFITHKRNGKVRRTEIYNGPIFGWESVNNA
ncbi:hypothetical protein BPS13_0059 [Bacillus phage BPS13]|uniref:Uncharacterized protein n=2 Tax=Wphvirus BPS13 TaxID=1987727 RepID=A0A173GBT8_9CAUD|nr:hypothetical protein BPS13_0059 [Bacillus phage BPS13]YP_009281969.1 hypothetical protein SALINJAH_15 [Bacillus phage SalinJah]AEZ50238.1 hypothetical protein BPS13_0059 [Bacillus phage BPS13]ANH50663.1 hypothetical protein SALINJAH_15 [Bacillus phage SalinJah]QQO38934.1 hypothetical protein BCPG1_203 [Bacillus phage BCPG1]